MKFNGLKSACMPGIAGQAARLVAFAVLAMVSAGLSAQVPPNIVVVMADDMGLGDASPYLNQTLGPNAARITKTLATPNLDRLAAEGTLFTDVHTAAPTCTPSRYALLTGRYPWRTYNKHKVIGSWSSPPMIAPGRPTLATLLRQYGYHTAAIGKWHIGLTFMDNLGRPLRFSWGNESNWNKVRTGTAAGGGYVDSILDGPLQHGFDEFFGMGGNFYLDQQSSLKAYIENNAFQGIPTWNGAPGSKSAGPGVPDWDEQRMGERYMNRALDFIDTHVATRPDRPFFMYYAPNANHEPHNPAGQIVVQGRSIPIRNQARFSNGTDATTRDDMVYENDVAVGLMLDKLAAETDPRTGRPLLESTLFIFTSDNGADRTVGDSGHAGLEGKKGSLYEGGHRVPFIVAWPDGGVPAGTLSRANFGQVDLYATLAALLGHTMQLDEAEDSANVLPVLLGQVADTAFQRSQSLVVQDDRHVYNDLPDDSLMLIRDQALGLMIDGKLINRNEVSGANRGQAVPIRLYDLDADLSQQNDRLAASDQQSSVSKLSNRLLAFHNQGYSRPLMDTPGLGGHILLTDGGIDLRNDRSGAIGYEFTVRDEPLSVASLGLWDDGAADYINHESKTMSDGQTSGIPDGLATEHVVRLFDGATRELIASVTVNNDNSYLDGEFRYVDLASPVALAAGQTYALTVDTAPGDRDMFHHFAAYSAVSPRRSDRVGNFVARIANTAGAYPGLYPDGEDGLYNRHPDMFRHRMFVGPNARLVSGPAERSPDGEPVYDAGTDRAIFLWREPDQTWRLRATAGGPRADYIGSFSADRPFSFVQPFSLESTDFLDTSDPNRIGFDLIATQSWQDGIDFAFPANANVCFDAREPAAVRVLLGAARTPVAVPFNLNDFGPCANASVGIDPDGMPAYDPGTDKGVFLWREADGYWRLRATGGGEWTEYAGYLSADKPFGDLQPFSVESKDLLDRSNPKTAVFEFGMTNAGEDGIDFAVTQGTGVCIDLRVPADATVTVGAVGKRVATPFNLADFGPCE